MSIRVGLLAVACVVGMGIGAVAVISRPPAVASAPWVDLGDVDGMGDHVYRTCDGHVTVYVTIHGPTGVSISTVPPPSSGFGDATPCT